MRVRQLIRSGVTRSIALDALVYKSNSNMPSFMPSSLLALTTSPLITKYQPSFSSSKGDSYSIESKPSHAIEYLA